MERSRIASAPTGERSFHVLYYLLAGTSSAEKSHLGLDIASANFNDGPNNQRRWRYLGHPTQLKVGINDADGFHHFKTALRKLEFPRADIAEICQILSSILHLGQLEFTSTQSTTPAADDSGGYSHEGGETVTTVRNRESLEIIAAFLGVSIQDLETCLGYKTKTLHRERVTVMLDPSGARDNADELARTLYSLLVAYVVEHINQRTCALDEAVSNTVSVVDFPGFAPQSASGSAFDQLMNNVATESMYHFCLHSFFEDKANLLESEEINVPPTSYFDNSDAVRGLLKPGNGLLSILDDQMRRGRTDMQFLDSLKKRFNGKNPAIEAGDTMATLPGSNFATRNDHASFLVRHWAGEVEYPVEGMLEENSGLVSGDVMNLMTSTKNDFVKGLFGQEALQTVYHPQEKTAVLQATLSSKPSRTPSMARRRGDRPERFGSRRFNRRQSAMSADDSGTPKQGAARKGRTEAALSQGASAEFLSSLDNITTSISTANTNPYFVFCLKPNDRRIANQFDSKCVRAQIQTLGIAEISQRLRNADFSVFLPFGEFLGASDAESLLVGSEREKVESLLEEKRWPANEARAGSTGVLLSERCWMQLARVGDPNAPIHRQLTIGTPNASRPDVAALGESPGGFNESKTNLLGGYTSANGYHDDKNPGFFGSREIDAKSETQGSAFNQGDMFRNMDTREEMAEKGNEKRMEEVDVKSVSGSRRRWLVVVWFLTWYLPDFSIRFAGRMKRKDIRVAWREKFAINLLIWLSCLFVVFFIGKSCPMALLPSLFSPNVT